MKNWKPKYTGNPGYTTYGKIFKVSWFHITSLLCVITPGTNWLIPFFYKLKNKELCRVTVHDR